MERRQFIKFLLSGIGITCVSKLIPQKELHENTCTNVYMGDKILTPNDSWRSHTHTIPMHTHNSKIF